MRVGILEDELEHAEQMIRALEGGGHSHQLYSTGQALLQALGRETFDLLVVDWMLPDTNGIAVLDQLRARGIAAPVLFATSRDAEEDIVTALGHGADDYLVKPLRPRELLARIEAIGRRAGGGAVAKVLSVSPYRFSLQTSEAWIGDEPVTLTQRQFALAAFLFRHPGQLLSRAHLLEAVWGVGEQVQTRTLEIHISQLRNLLRLTPENGWRIASVYGHGYRLEHLD